MANADRDVRKVTNEARRTYLGDRINVDSAELNRLVADYEDILDEEGEEAKEEGFVPLYDVSRGTWVSTTRDPLSLFFFDHIDGAYSYCLSLDGKLIHYGASTLVQVHDLALDSPARPAPTPGQFRT
jgi:hypothetical protein